MSLTLLLQVAFDFFLLSGVAIVWMRMRGNDGDDPRMSRSLQLLQSKISILEDLSDRIDDQLTQAAALMEHKRKELDARIGDADRVLQTIQQSRDKSLEVAKIFQDRIPHKEIIERQRTIEYVKAARLAHQGVDIQEIAKQVSLPMGELELIAKMNREHLQFSLEDLPDWAQAELAEETPVATPAPIVEMPAPVVAAPTRPMTEEDVQTSLAQIGDRLRKASARVDSFIETPVPELEIEMPAPVQVPVPPAAVPVAPMAAAAPPAQPRVFAQQIQATFVQPVAQPAVTPIAPKPAPIPVVASPDDVIPVLSPKSRTQSATPPAALPQEEQGRNSRGENVIVQKIVFPKIDVNQHLS